MAKMYRALDSQSPVGDTLYFRTLVGDLVSNAAYFSLVGIAPPKSRLVAGVALGILAGLGAVTLPAKFSLSEAPTAKTPVTSLLTVALYTAGGIAAALVAGSGAQPDDSSARFDA